MRRRDFFAWAGRAAALGLVAGWPGRDGAASVLEWKRRRRCVEPAADGPLAHVLATAGPTRLLVKASFREPLARPPVLRVGSRYVPGLPTSGVGRFFAFDARSLRPGVRYPLELLDGYKGCALAEPWTLATLPPPDAWARRLRVLVYTCAGGHDLFRLYVPVPVRRRLLRRALDFAPDAVLAIGDHVYWDLRSFPSALFTGASPQALAFAGEFDREAPVLGGPNEAVLLRAVDGQIADLYGTLLRSVPVFFLRDDHDYFEDDRASEDLVTFPPDPFMRALARATQWLYYPELLPDRTRPPLPGSHAPDRPAGVSEAFGTLRWGRLVELLLYDCKGFLGGAQGGLVPLAVESWLAARMAHGDAAHVVNVPSNPVGWSAGKYAEWYPDVVAENRLTDTLPKAAWRPAWLAQHDRLLHAASRRAGLPLFLSGDIHSIAESRIVRSGALDLSRNPVVSLISGTPGTRWGWPSLARGGLAGTPTAITSEPVVPVEEVNGFHLVDFEPGRVTIRHFRWDLETQPEEAIDGLQPFHVSTYQT
jgi:hypothetical protein